MLVPKQSLQIVLLHEDWVEFNYSSQYLGLARDDIPAENYMLKLIIETLKQDMKYVQS